MKKFLLLILVFLSFTISFGAEKVKVAIIYSVGGLGDEGFNDWAKAGLEKAKKELGIVYNGYAPMDPSTETENKLRDYAESKEYALIIVTGFSEKDSLVNAAKDFPELKFAIIDEVVEDLPNVSSITFNDEEMSFLAGITAGLTTKSNVVGFIGGAKAPLIEKYEKGYEQGAKYINPKIKVLVSYIGGSNAFNDPKTAEKKTDALISKKADVVYHASGASGKGVFEAAKKNGKYAIGVASNQDSMMEGTVLTSAVANVEVGVFLIMKELVNGNLEGKVYRYGIKEDGVGLTDFKYTKDVIGENNIKKINDVINLVKSGEIKVVVSE